MARMRSLPQRLRTCSFVALALTAVLAVTACSPASSTTDSGAGNLAEAPDPRATMEPGESAQTTDRTIVGAPRPPADVREDEAPVEPPTDEAIDAVLPSAPATPQRPRPIGVPANGAGSDEGRPGGPIATPSPSPLPEPEPGLGAVRLPPIGGLPDYQLGGAYEPDAALGVSIVGRDREAAPLAGAYSICYVNGFQSQPGERHLWSDDLVVHVDGQPLIDPNWPDEVLLDTSTPQKRAAILEIVRPWIEGCAASGFDAVEFDNLDTFTRDGVPLQLEHNLEMARQFVQVAHRVGLAAAQKNTAEHSVALRAQAAFDFALAEECAMWDECSVYSDVYGSAVVDIEYTDDVDPARWAEICADGDTPASVVLRDRNLVSVGHPDYEFAHCAR